MQLSLVLGSFLAGGNDHRAFQVREPNLYAPEVYADHLDFVATLVNLPGAQKKQSRWELSYQLFFIPEDKYQEALTRLPRDG